MTAPRDLAPGAGAISVAAVRGVRQDVIEARRRVARLAADRARDEVVLAAVRDPAAGGDLRSFAARVGFHVETVRSMTNSVRAADLAESGEPVEMVAACYWEPGT